MTKKHLLSRSKKNGNPIKRSHVSKQDCESGSSFAPEDDEHEDDGMDVWIPPLQQLI